MNTNVNSLISLMASVVLLQAQGKVPKLAPAAPPPPPPVVAAPVAPSSSQTYVYEQKPLAGRPYLVAPEQAQTVVNRFKEAYSKMGQPRFLIYVNRELVDEESGLKLSARSEQKEIVRGDVNRTPSADDKAGGNRPANSNAGGNGTSPAATLESFANQAKVSGEVEKVSAKNTYRNRERKPSPLADKQTVREVERLFGRPLRMAGATLVDQNVATQLIAGRPLKEFITPTDGEQAHKDREALAKHADVVLEVLVTSRQVTVAGISGDKVYSVPDIQTTAIRLKDAKIIGQASASDLIGHGNAAGKAAQNFGVREITEATALSLMEDMAQFP